MNICLTFAVQGRLKLLFDSIKKYGLEPHWIVSSGDFGVWPDPARMDRASKKHASNEFALRYVGADPAPIMVPVLTIAGVHDDNRFLQERQAANNTQILENVHWLAQGFRTTIGFEGPPCRVTGFGRAYSEATYNGQYGKRSNRHYTRRDVERACSSGPTDLLVVYEHLDAPGIRNIIYATRPKLICTNKHHNRKVHDTIQGIPVVSLERGEIRMVYWRGNLFNY